MSIDLAASIAGQLGLRLPDVAATVELLDAGNTIPFIARYRKERTGGLDEEQLRSIDAERERLRALEERRATIVGAIEEQGKLTPELRERLLGAATRTELEDLYQPYRARRRTRASVARERGLEALADVLAAQPRDTRSPDELARPFLTAEVPSAEDAWPARATSSPSASPTTPTCGGSAANARCSGARCSPTACQKATIRAACSRPTTSGASASSGIKPYQVLALNRGEAEGVLRVRVAVPERDWQAAIASAFRADRRSPLAEHLQLAIADAAERLLLPAIERDVRRELSERAGAHAIAVFAANLRQLLSQPPLAGSYRWRHRPWLPHRLKVAVVDRDRQVAGNSDDLPASSPSINARPRAKVLAGLGRQHGITLSRSATAPPRAKPSSSSPS